MSGDDDIWSVLERELDAWGAAGRTATFWWRDDDSVAPSPELDHLLDLAAASAAPLALAVIPAEAEPALATRLDEHAAASPTSEIHVLQHGWAHRNHAPDGEKKCELVDPARHRALPDELRRGRRRLEEIFGDRCLPVQVPPWNRLDPALLTRLPGLGFTGISIYKARAVRAPLPGLIQANCHLDILQWRPEPRFLGTRAALDLLCGHLAARRGGDADPAEPSGVLSHHRVHDAAAWDFLAELLARLAGHPAVRLLEAAEIFASRPQRPAMDRRA